MREGTRKKKKRKKKKIEEGERRERDRKTKVEGVEEESKACQWFDSMYQLLLTRIGTLLNDIKD